MASIDKGGDGQGAKGDISCAKLDNSILVPPGYGNGTTVNTDTQHSTEAAWDTEDTFSGTETVPYGTLAGENIELSHMAKELISNSIRAGTKKKYSSIEEKWVLYCHTRDIPEKATTTTYANFLAEEFSRNLKYTYIRSYHSALKSYTKDVDWDVLDKLMKGMYNRRPPTPRYTAIWDVNVLLNFIREIDTGSSFMNSSKKLSVLLMLLSGNRVNMLTNFKITQENMTLTDTECSFRFDNVLKHSRSGKSEPPMTFLAYPNDRELCPVQTIISFLQKRAELCPEPYLFITTTKPYRRASSQTIARWIKRTMLEAGLNTNVYSAHSCRAASSSAAYLAGVGISTILKSASWSNVTTFKKFYLKELTNVYDMDTPNFGSFMLENFYCNNNM